MKGKTRWLAVVLVLVVLVLAAVHLHTRSTATEGALVVETAAGETEIRLGALSLVPIQGELVDGKGERHSLDAQGLPLRQVLEDGGVDLETVAQVTVLADDAYSASVTREELLREQDVCLVEEEEGLSLVVLSDSNRKRNVSNVVRIIIEP